MSFFFDTQNTDPLTPPPAPPSGDGGNAGGFVFDTSNVEPPVPTEVSAGRRTGLFENVGAAFDTAVSSETTTSQAVNEARARDERIAAIEKVSGKSFSATIQPFRPGPGQRASDDQTKIDDLAVDRWLETIPERQRAGILPSSMLRARADEIAHERLAQDASIMARARGGWEAFGGFVGSTAGLMTDPLNIAGLALGAPLSAGVVRTALTEAGVAALTQTGVELVNEPYRRELGLPSGLDRALGNIALTAAGAGILSSAFKGAPVAGRALVDRLAGRESRPLASEVGAAFDQVQAFDDLMHANPFGDTPQARAEHQDRARQVDEAVMNGSPLPNFETTAPHTQEASGYRLEPSTPEAHDINFGRSNPGRMVFSIVDPQGKPGGFLDIDKIENGVAHIGDVLFIGAKSNDGRNSLGPSVVRDLLRQLRDLHPEIKSLSGERVSGARFGGDHHFSGEGTQVTVNLPPATRDAFASAAPAPADAVGNQIYHFNPAELSVDAGAYQFKAGGDEAGVTDRLAGVKRWDPVRAGLAIVHERMDGTRYIADGHQRLGLAQRIAATDPAQKPMLTGFLLREADGVTLEDARVIAALKNIAEGTGSPIDAAKVLRARPDAAIDLPPSSALVRDAQGLAHLSDEGFGMVVNGLVPERYAAILGKLASDQAELHGQVLKLLAQERPANAIEAESMIRDALSAPAVRETQTDMFGTAASQQILYKERAQVLSGAARRLAQDKQAFSLLVRERARIEEAGNILDASANARRAQDDGQTLEALQKLARRKGPIADALAQAAEDLRAGRPRSAIIGRFIEDVRRAAEEELRNGGTAGAARPADEGIVNGSQASDAGSQSVDLLNAALKQAADEPSLFGPVPGEINPATAALAREGLLADVAESAKRFDKPGGPGTVSQARQLATDLSRDIDRSGDFQVGLEPDDAGGIKTQSAKSLLDEHISDMEFLDVLKACLK